MKIGLISDTHGQISSKILHFLKDCTEVWHAGDIGSTEVINIISKTHVFRAVSGNIDDLAITENYKEFLSFKCEEVGVLMIHIGGYPTKYTSKAKNLIGKYQPDLFISGHSHILKVIYDPIYSLLHMNPGAAGKFGIHQFVTALRFDISGQKIENVEICELNKSNF